MLSEKPMSTAGPDDPRSVTGQEAGKPATASPEALDTLSVAPHWPPPPHDKTAEEMTLPSAAGSPRVTDFQSTVLPTANASHTERRPRALEAPSPALAIHIPGYE